MQLRDELTALAGDQPALANHIGIILDRSSAARECFGRVADLAAAARLDTVRLTLLSMKVASARGEAASKSPPQVCRDTSAWVWRDHLPLGIDTADLLLLVGELHLLGALSWPLSRPLLTTIARRCEHTWQQLSEADEEQQQTYRGTLSGWLDRHRELRRLIGMCDDLAQREQLIRQRFMERFGEPYMETQSQSARVQAALQRIATLQGRLDGDAYDVYEGSAPPDRSAERAELGFSDQYLRLVDQDARRANDEDYRKARKLLRRIAATTHPDKVRHLGVGADRQAALQSVWARSAPYREAQQDTLVLSAAVETLQALLTEAQQIVSCPDGEYIDSALMIPGGTLAEQQTWLQQASELLDEQLGAVQIEHFHARVRDEIEFMEALLQAPASVQRYEVEAMRETALGLQLEAERAEARVRQLRIAIDKQEQSDERRQKAG